MKKRVIFTMSVLFTLSLLLPGQKVSAGTILGSATGKTLSKKLPHYTPDKGPIVRSASMKSALTMPNPTPKNKKKATQAKKKNKSKEPQPKEQLRANIGNIRVESLRYTCYRFQSDAVGPHFINKHKPVKDLWLKIDRCLTTATSGVSENAKWFVTYTNPGGTQQERLVDRDTWVKMEPKQCYRATRTQIDLGEKILTAVTPAACF